MNGLCLLLVLVGVATVSEALSAFRKKKIAQHFVLADCQKDQILLPYDYTCIVNNIMTILGYNKIDPDTFRNVVAVNAWDAFPKKNTTLDEYYALVESTPDEGIDTVARNLSKQMFKAWAQPDNEETMDATELSNEFKSLGKQIDLDEQGQLAFKAMDTNKDGKVSLLEYQDCASKFLRLEDESDPSRYFFGDLDRQ